MPLAALDLEAARRRARLLVAAAQALGRAGFGERTVCSWYGAALVSDIRYLAPPAVERRPRRGLGGWIALWLAGEEVERRALGALDEGQLDALAASGLLTIEGEAVRASVALVPIAGVLVVADRLDEASPGAVPAPDLSAWNMAHALPPTAGSLLDVGCGAGALSLASARRGCRVIGTDIDGRALAFASLGAILNRLPAVFVEGDLFAGVDERFDAACFNAPLVRAPLAGELPLYLRSPRGEALVSEFLAGVGRRVGVGGEALCHAQLTPAIEAASASAGFSAGLALHFADAVDGTPHALISLRRDLTHAWRRLRVPLGPALPHLRRELLDRLHAAQELLERGAALETIPLRPAPWLELARCWLAQGTGFRLREQRFGALTVDDEDVRLLERCQAGLAASSAAIPGRDQRLRRLVERGLLVA